MSRDFDGTTGRIDFGADTAMLKTLDEVMTIAAWVYPDSVTGVHTVLACNDWSANSGLKGYQFGTSGDELTYVKLGNATLTTTTITTTTGAWQFIACAMTVSNNDFYHVTAAGTVTTEHNTNATTLSVGTTHHSLIGARSAGSSGGATNFFDGKIAEVAVWISQKLTQDQILAYMYGGPFAGVVPNFYAPVWGVASPEPELCGNVVSATLTGTAPQADHSPTGPRPLVRLAA